MMEEQFILSTMKKPEDEVESQSKQQSEIEEQKAFEHQSGLERFDAKMLDPYY